MDITLDMSDTELISNLTLDAEGKLLDTQCSSGSKACKSATSTILSNPNVDCPVTFVIATNKPDLRDGSDALRGEKVFDDVDFSG